MSIRFRPSSVPPRCLLPLWLAAVCAACCSHLCASLPLPWIGATGPYHSPSSTFDASAAQIVFRITDPPHLRGSLVVSPSPFAGQHFKPAAGSNHTDCDVPLRFVLPHSNETDSTFGCQPYMHPVNDEGEPLAGSVLFAERRGGCVFQPKSLYANSARVSALVIINCAACPPGFVKMVGLQSEAPVVLMQTPDGFRLRQYLLDRRAWLANSSLPNPHGYNYSMGIMGVAVGTGATEPTERAALVSIARDMQIGQGAMLDWEVSLPNWSRLLDANSSLDPCLDRLVGIWCERGRIVAIQLWELDVTGRMHAAFGSLSHLRHLTITENGDVGLTGDVPAEMCALQSLRSIELEHNSLQSLPDCIGTHPLESLIVGRNQIRSLPASLVLSNRTLTVLVVPFNQLVSLPRGFSSLHKLVHLEAHGNPTLQEELNATSLSFRGFTQLTLISAGGCGFARPLAADAFSGCNALTTVDLRGNQLGGILPPSVFDGLSALTSVDLSSNQLSGLLPTFLGCSALTTITLQHNRFVGGIPSSWAALSRVGTITLSHNDLSGPISVVASLASLTHLYLDHNRIVNDYFPPPSSPSASLSVTLLTLGMSSSLKLLALNDNSLSGDWRPGYAIPLLLSLNLSSNHLTAIPSDLWTGAAALIDADFSNNSIAGGIGSYIRPEVRSFLMHQNPLSLMPLPPWLQFSGQFEATTALMECQPLVSSLAVRFTADAAATQYLGCKCTHGAYATPAPPNCSQLPLQVSVPPSSPSRLLSDAIFVPQPFGLKMSWVMDLQWLRKDGGAGAQITAAAARMAASVPSSDALQPVRLIRLLFRIRRAAFIAAGATIEVSDGSKSLVHTISPDTLIAAHNGTAAAETHVAAAEPATSRLGRTQSSWIAPVTMSLDADVSELSLWTYGNLAYVSLESPTPLLVSLFNATYSYDFECPVGSLLLLADLGYQCVRFVDGVYLSGRNGSYAYECLAVQTDRADAVLQAMSNPADVNYTVCRCQPGTFGLPPFCDRIPYIATVQPFAAASADELTHDLASLLDHSIDAAPILVSSQSGSTVPEAAGPITRFNVSRAALPSAISDSWYGGLRLTKGLSTSWLIELRDLRMAVGGNGSGVERNGYPLLHSRLIPADAPLQPVRTITCRLHLSRSYFTGSANALSVFEGDASQAGERVFVVDGVNAPTLCTLRSGDTPFTNQSSYTDKYGALIQSLGADAMLCPEIHVSSNQASVFFASRDPSDTHLVLTYSFSYACAPGTELTSASGVTECKPPSSSSSVSSIIAVVVGASAALLLLLFVWVLRERFVRHRTQTKIRALCSSDAAPEGAALEDRRSQLDANNIRQLKREFAIALGGELLELGFVLSNWLTVRELVLSPSADAAGSSASSVSDRMRVAFVVVVILATFAFVVNALSQALLMSRLRIAWREYRSGRTETETLRKQLESTERKIMCTHITGVALLFDSMPVAALLLATELQRHEPATLRSLLWATLIIGAKLSQLCDLSRLKADRLRLEYAIFLLRSASRRPLHADSGEKMATGRATIDPFVSASDPSMVRLHMHDDEAGSQDGRLSQQRGKPHHTTQDISTHVQHQTTEGDRRLSGAAHRAAQVSLSPSASRVPRPTTSVSRARHAHLSRFLAAAQSAGVAGQQQHTPGLDHSTSTTHMEASLPVSGRD